MVIEWGIVGIKKGSEIIGVNKIILGKRKRLSRGFRVDF